MTTRLFWLFSILVFTPQLFAEPPFFENIDLLGQKGFENLVIRMEDSARLVVQYENRFYRDELYAAAVVMALIDEHVADSLDVILMPCRRAMPVCKLVINRQRYHQFLEAEGADNDEAFIGVEKPDAALPWQRRNVANPSFKKLDLTVYPTFSVYLGNYDDRFKLFLAAMPVVSTTLWPGAAAYVEASIPLYNDVNYEYFRFIDYPQLSKAAISQFVILPFDISAAISFGLYNPNRYGWAGEINKRFFHRRLSIGYSFEYTGFLLYYQKEWYKSDIDLVTSKFYGYYHFDALNCRVGLSYNRYVMKDSGWLFEFTRNFHETTAGLFAGTTQIDKFGGVMFRFPFSRPKRTRPGKFRVTMPRYYEYSYRATNKVYTQHSPVQSGISIYTGTKLTYLDDHLTPNYVNNNLALFRSARQDVREQDVTRGDEENLLPLKK